MLMGQLLTLVLGILVVLVVVVLHQRGAVFVVVAAVAVADDDFVFAIEPKLVTMQRKLMNWW